METATTTTALGVAPTHALPRLGEVRYSLTELLNELQVERTMGSFSQEKLHQAEINKLFKKRREIVVSHSPTASLGDLIRKLPAFEFFAELALLEQGTPRGLPLLERIIEQGIVPKDVAYKIYADLLEIAYFEPFA